MAGRGWTCVCGLAVAVACLVSPVEAATINVPAGGNLQAALDAARPGDVILLAEGAEFLGNFVLPNKAGDGWITVRSGAPDAMLPADGVRVQPGHAPLLARLRSPNSNTTLRTAAGAHHWDLRYLDLPATVNGYGDIIQIGDGSNAQNSLARVPHHIELSHLYVHGDPLYGQKRCVALNASYITIRDSYIAECKAVGQDSQAIGGWNGPGPYTIENNYLEAAAENFLLGGADPAIAGLVADGVVFRRNYLSRPMAWRNPVLATPSSVTVTAVTGGSLPAGTYSYRIIARRAAGLGTIARSAASAAVSTTLAAPSAVRVRWQAVPGAAEYRVYGRTPGGENVYWRVTGTEFVDTGATGTSEAVPTSAGTLWSVKNLFELKSARNVVVENNVMENHWKESQPGYAIVLTPRNSNGGCTWCVIEHVRIEGNIVRNVAAGINLTGYDAPSRPTRQTNDIVIRGNLFTGLDTSLGGNGWFLLIGDAPRDVVIEHNTIDSNATTIVNVYGGSQADPSEIVGFRMSANAARHAAYGINGSYFSFGNGILANYFPGAVFTGNYLQGGTASRYPASNLFAGAWADQFVGAAAGNYALSANSLLRHAAVDGSDIGVDYAALLAAVSGVDTGIVPGANQSIRAPNADMTVSCTFLDCAFADATAAGSGTIAGWQWTFGDGTQAVGASVSHRFAAPGTYDVTLTVIDSYQVTATATRAVTVELPNTPPDARFVQTCADLVCTFTDGSTDADGRIVARAWTLGSATSATATPSVRFTAPGTYAITLTVTDDDGATAMATGSAVVTGVVHAAYSGSTLKWSNASGSTSYWSADVVVQVHGADERAIAGATVTAAWSGAVAKSASCVTDAAGACTLKSGTLSYGRSSVSLAVTAIAAPGDVFDGAASHTAAGPAAAITLTRP